MGSKQKKKLPEKGSGPKKESCFQKFTLYGLQKVKRPTLYLTFKISNLEFRGEERVDASKGISRGRLHFSFDFDSMEGKSTKKFSALISRKRNKNFP